MKHRDKQTFSCVLSDAEEKKLVDWLLECCRNGFPRKRKDLQHSVKLFFRWAGKI